MNSIYKLIGCMLFSCAGQIWAQESETSTQLPPEPPAQEDEGSRLFEEPQWTPSEPDSPNLEKNIPPPVDQGSSDSENAEVQGTEAKRNQDLMNREEGDMNEVPDSLRHPRLWKIGPTVSLSFPYLLSTSIDAILSKAFSFGVGYGQTGVSKDLGKSLGEVKAQVHEWDVRVRYHPFLGDFFVGLSSGVMNVKFEAQKKTSATANDQTISGLVDSKSEIKARFINPHMGWLSCEDSGFTIGFEFGLHIPLKASSSFSAEARDPNLDSELKQSPEFKEQKDDLDSLVKKFEKTPIPYINFLRIGWLF